MLVDGDLRRPSVHKRLDLAGGAGFSTVLSGAASLAEVLKQTKFPNLTVLTCGRLSAESQRASRITGSQECP